MTNHVHTPTVQFGPVLDRRTVLVRQPSPHLASGEVTHIGRRPVDIELAFDQWTNYVEAFRIANLTTFLVNSFIIAITVMVLVVFIASLGAYALSRLN